MDKIIRAIEKKFKGFDLQVLFWYDADGSYALEIASLVLPAVEIIVVENNEFSIKHKILMGEPSKKYLLYFKHARPVLSEDWLADLLLANAELRIDAASMVLGELGLGPEFISLVQDHEFFFNAPKRVAELKKLLEAADTQSRIRWKMLAVCCNSAARWDEVLMNLFGEVALDKTECFELIKKSELEQWLWRQVKNILGYASSKATVKDLIIELFIATYHSDLGEKIKLDSEAIYLLKRFKDHTRHQAAFRNLSGKCSEWLGIKQDLLGRRLDELVDMDYYELIERKILSELSHNILNSTGTQSDVEKIIHQRMLSHWYKEYEHEYLCLESSSQLLNLIRTADLSLHSMEEGLEKYLKHWHKIDYQYRKFIYHYLQARHQGLFTKLYTEVENRYLNGYLFPISTSFTACLQKQKQYISAICPSQARFWEQQIKPYLEAGKKIFVVISDAMRYEIGAELLSLIRQEDKYEAELAAQLGMLPSYTQLGMAALLPHEQICLAEDGSGQVFVDGLSTMGSQNRAKILNKHSKALLLKADEVLTMSSIESRHLYRDHDVIYVYQNRIDAMGDVLSTETKVFEAVETSNAELIEILRKLTAGNATNIIITSDHGFLYQHQVLDDSDFVSETDVTGTVLYKNRRFILGKELKTSFALMHFSSRQLGIDNDMDVMIPRANQRMKLQGSGSRFVHGGAALQEIVIPILKINKKRVSDVDFVDVDIISSSERIISTGQLVVKLFQSEPVSDKKQALTLKIGIYTQAGDLISEEKTIPFDFSSASPREREFQCALVLSTKADEANNQNVVLRLEKPISGTNRFQLYKTAEYQLRRSFSSDF